MNIQQICNSIDNNINPYMQYFKGSNLKKIFNGIVQSHYKRDSQMCLQSQQQVYDVSDEDAIQFIQNLLASDNKIDSEQKINGSKNNKRQLSLYDGLNVEPLYMQDVKESKLMGFEIQLGITQQRVEVLSQQLHQIMNAQQKILQKGDYALLDIFDILSRYLQQFKFLQTSIAQMRTSLKKINTKPPTKYLQKFNKMLIIKKKLQYLKRIKQYKSKTTFTCENLEQIFYIEQQKHKCYRHLANSQQIVSKVRCLSNIHKNLIQQASKHISIFQENLKKWAKGELNSKQIEKLLILIYYSLNQAIYLKNTLKINFLVINSVPNANIKLVQTIQKVKNSDEHHYIKGRYKQQILCFLNELEQIIKQANQINQNV